MAESPLSNVRDLWLSIVGIGEDGLDGLSGAARAAIQEADSVFGGKRHLALAAIGDKGRRWPEPFDIAPLLAMRGGKTVALVSGDPFWFGAGSVLTRTLARGEWRAFPAVSTFSHAATALGWPVETTQCIGLHAAPIEEITPFLHHGARVLCLLRDGTAPAELAAMLTAQGYGSSTIHVLETLGGPRARQRACQADSFDLDDVAAPVMAALEVSGPAGLPASPGLPDTAFAHDGQITKAPMRALTLSALAPRRNDVLWDIGAGSGSISIEWCHAGGKAVAIEKRADRTANIRTNAHRFGIARRLTLVEGNAPEALAGLPSPDAVFIGGGTSAALLDQVWTALSSGGRIVFNAVTLESESLAIEAQARRGGSLLRVELATTGPLGHGRGWQPSRPVVQWSAVK